MTTSQQEIQSIAHMTAEDVLLGKGNNDLAQAVQDIDDAKRNMSPTEYGAYLKAVNKELSQGLPNVEIVGTTEQDGVHKLVATESGDKGDVFFRSSDQVQIVEPKSDGTLKNEKRGPVEVTTDDAGNLVGVKDKFGNIFSRGNDGKWTSRPPGVGVETPVGNVTVDDKGNLAYDEMFPGAPPRHVEKRVDGSYSVSGEYYGGKLAYDKNGDCVEAPAGAGHIRKFHYNDKRELDQIDGRLGHWDRRVDAEGKSEWVNKDNHAVWKGEFKVDVNGNLEFRGRDGGNWKFTRTGQDQPL